MTGKLAACLLGTAIGDSIGLPYEGLGPLRIAKFLRKPLAQRLVCNRGMLSDDTEHTCLVAVALIRAKDNPDRFEKYLARSLCVWFWSLPAGVGLATAKAALKLSIGFPCRYSGVFSAGNGPAMRSALIGLFYQDDVPRLKEFVYRSTRLTHTDPKAYQGALTVALTARYAALHDNIISDRFFATLTEQLGNINTPAYQQLLDKTRISIEQKQTLSEFSVSIGCTKGISGYMYHTVPAVLHGWLRHQQDFAAGLEELIRVGGDTDSTGAIYGAIAASQQGTAAIPGHWLSGLCDWPRSRRYLQKLADALEKAKAGQKSQIPYLFFPVMLLRNLVFLMLVLLIGFRRCFPPY